MHLTREERERDLSLFCPFGMDKHWYGLYVKKKKKKKKKKKGINLPQDYFFGLESDAIRGSYRAFTSIRLYSTARNLHRMLCSMMAAEAACLGAVKILSFVCFLLCFCLSRVDHTV
jgi:hypothetical protein